MNIAVFDIETFKFINPYSLAMYDGKDYRLYTGSDCVKKFLDEVLNYKYRAVNFYAHNGGKFDFNFLVEYLRFRDYDFKMVFQGSRCLRLRVYHTKEGKSKDRKNRNATSFSDSYSLLKFSLDKLTKNFDVKHKKINFMEKPEKQRDYEYLYELYKKKDKRFYEYVKNDVFGLYEVLIGFNKMITENNGKMGLTIASTSLKTFRNYYKYDRHIEMANKETNKEMKNAYYGGRTEIFKMFVKEKKLYCYDINSLYPFVMFNNEYPVCPPRLCRNSNKNMIMEYHGITEAEIRAPKNLYIPLLPYHYTINGNNKLVFPLGKFTGYWDNHLLRKAYDLGYEIKPIKTYVFGKTEMIFKEYVKRFYKLKQTSLKDTPNYIIAKLLLNSLYGKFGQRQESEIFIKYSDLKFNDFKEISVYDPDSHIFKVKTESQGKFFIPQISIHVTAMSLLQLYSHIENILKKGFLIYCDTDSLFTNVKLPISEKIGGLKLEYEFNKGYFLLPKTYCVIKKNNECYIRAKGYGGNIRYINKKDKKIDRLNENVFKNALFKNDYSGFALESTNPSFNSMRTSFVRHKKYVSMDILKKSIRSKYDKRIVLPDFDTLPLVL